MVGFSTGPSGGEQLQLIVDIVTGDQSGLESLDQMKARVLQLDQVIKAMSKSAQESYQAFQQMGRIDASSWHGALPAMTEVERVTKSAKDSFKDFAEQGLVPATKAVNENSTGISKWLVNAANIHGTFANIQGTLASISPMFKEFGAATQEIGFGIAGIAMGGMSAVLGIANIATAGVRMFADMGHQAGEFYNQLILQSNVMGMTIEQTFQLQTAMELAGGHVNQITIFSQRLTKAMEDLQSGTDNVASRALKDLGVSITDDNGMLRDTYSVLIDVMRALNGMTNETQQTATAGALLGLRGRESLAVIRDLNTLIPQANDLIARHGNVTDGAAEHQKKYNAAQEELKFQWLDLTTGVGPAWINVQQGIIEKVNDAIHPVRTLTQAWANLREQMSLLAQGDLKGYYNYMPQPGSAAYPPFSGVPEGDYKDKPFGSITRPGAKRPTQPWELDSSESGSAPYDIGKFTGGSKGPATGYSGLMAQQLDLPAAKAAFEEFAHGPYPKEFVFNAQKGKQAIQEWTMANKEWDEVLQKVRLEELHTKIAITDLRLAGDHSSQTFLDMEARLTGLGEAETYLNMKRHEAMDGYSTDIEALRQSMQNARTVTRALVIDIQGRSTPQGRSQIAKDAVGNDFMTQMVGSRQAPGGSIQFHNHGVVTTPEVADWFAQMLSAMQRAGRTQLSGT